MFTRNYLRFSSEELRLSHLQPQQTPNFSNISTHVTNGRDNVPNNKNNSIKSKATEKNSGV